MTTWDGYHSFLGWFYKEYAVKKTTKKKFTQREKDLLRPIAEVFAILDGNAFFGVQRNDAGEDTWYEQYLPEAWIVYKGQGKNGGWINETSWAKDMQHENDAVKDAWQQWRLLKILSRST